MAEPEKLREYAEREVDNLKYFSAGNFVVLTIALILFRFYGDELRFGKLALFVASLLSLWSMVVYALASGTLRDWILHSLKDEFLSDCDLPAFTASGHRKAPMLGRLLTDALFNNAARIRDFSVLFKDVQRMIDRGIKIQVLSAYAFASGLVFFGLANL